MSGLSVLFIGGTGVISSACVHAAVAQGLDVTVLNRGTTTTRPLPEGVRQIVADVRRPALVRRALEGRAFDVVVDFLTFTPEQLNENVALFSGRVSQFVFISSASAYQTPPARVPVLESTPLCNPYLQYSRDKIACEDLLVGAYRHDGFPATIVRPSHTYDATAVPFDGGWTVVDRMRRGLDVVVVGDGTSLWTLTHATDFAGALVALLGNASVVGDSFHITSDEALTWNQIAETLARAAGVRPRIVHVTTDAIAAFDEDWASAWLGDKAHSMVFDNSKIKSVVPGWAATVPFWQGAREIVAWYDADASRRQVDREHDAELDRLIAHQNR